MDASSSITKPRTRSAIKRQEHPLQSSRASPLNLETPCPGGFRVWGLGLRVQSLGFRVQGHAISRIYLRKTVPVMETPLCAMQILRTLP